MSNYIYIIMYNKNILNSRVYSWVLYKVHFSGSKLLKDNKHLTVQSLNLEIGSRDEEKHWFDDSVLIEEAILRSAMCYCTLQASAG